MLEKLCHIDEIADPGAKGFNLKQGRTERLLFLIKKEGQIYAYENKCPHAGLNLEWQDCVGGPCSGASLTALKIELDDAGHVILLP